MLPKVRKKYLKVIELMNEKSLLKFPSVCLNSLIRCYELVMSEEEADFLIAIGHKKLEKSQLRKYSALKDEEYEDFITEIFKKRMLFLTYEDNGVYAELATIFPGWVEAILSDPNKTPEKLEFSIKVHEMLDSLVKANVLPIRLYFNHLLKKEETQTAAPISISTIGVNADKKTISIEKKLNSSINVVSPSSEIRTLLDSLPHDYPIASMICGCRSLKKQLGDQCKYDMPSENVCITLGNLAKQLVTYGIANYISKDAATEIINACEKKGAIHNVYHHYSNSNNVESAICNCCLDCCVVYSPFNKGGLIPIVFRSHYKATIANGSQCISCNKCNKFCPTNAIGISESTGTLTIENQSCIGCGQCAYQCPKNVINMVYEPRNVFVRPLTKNKVRLHENK